MENKCVVNEKLKDINKRIYEYAEVNDGEISEELEHELRQIEDIQESNFEDYALKSKRLKTKVEALKEQEKALYLLRKKTELDIESTRRTLGILLKGEKFKSKFCSVSYRKSTAVIKSDIESIPDEFKEQVVSWKVDTKKLKDALMNQDIAGAYLQENISVIIK